MARRSDHTRAELKKMILDAAKRIVMEDSLGQLTIRRIAKEIGYTSGTLYLLFKNRDNLILELHINTLTDLHTCLSEVILDEIPEIALKDLADAYLKFTRENQNLWNAIFDFKLAEGNGTSESYDRTIFKLIDLGISAIRPLYPDDRINEAIHDARVLWASLYGIAALDASKKLSRYEDASLFIASLVDLYVSGIRQRMAGSET